MEAQLLKTCRKGTTRYAYIFWKEERRDDDGSFGVVENLWRKVNELIHEIVCVSKRKGDIARRDHVCVQIEEVGGGRMTNAQVTQEVVRIGTVVVIVGGRKEDDDCNARVETKRVNGTNNVGNILLLRNQGSAV